MKAAARWALWCYLACLLCLVGLYLAACGGGNSRPGATAETTPPGASQTAAAAVSPASNTAAASVSAGSNTAPAAVSETPAPSFAQVWAETWPALRLAGWTTDSQAAPCAGQETDPGTKDSPAAWVQPDAWATVGAPHGATVAGGQLLIDDTQTAMGWALLSGRTFDTSKPVRLSGLVELVPDTGAWLGLTLHHGEGDYRELSIYEAGGKLKLGTWAPCFIRWGIADVSPGAHLVTLEYTPPPGGPGGICWRYLLDQLLQLVERCDDRGAQLDGPARAGLFAVNLRAESQRLTSRLRATVGALTVEQP